MIVVTPYIVRPVTDPTQLRLPTDGWQPPNDLERILLLRQSARASRSGTANQATPHIPGRRGLHGAMTEDSRTWCVIPACCSRVADPGRLRFDRPVPRPGVWRPMRYESDQSASDGGACPPTLYLAAAPADGDGQQAAAALDRLT